MVAPIGGRSLSADGGNSTAAMPAMAAAALARMRRLRRFSLAITSAMFDVVGARAATGNRGFDRYWRNVRTHTLHDPVAHKIREVGDYFLNDVVPVPTAYS